MFNFPVEFVVEGQKSWGELESSNNDYLLIDKDYIGGFLAQNSNPIFQKIVSEDSNTIPQELREKIDSLVDELNFNHSITPLVLEILNKLFFKISTDFHISRSNQEELLFYVEKNDTYFNFLIDSEGDIELMMVPKSRKDIKSVRFYKEDNFELSEVFESINALF